MLRKWEELPGFMKNKQVKAYYKILCKRQSTLKIKRVLDIFMALFLLILLFPVMLVTAIVIKCDSQGPIFYRQERITQYGKTYRIFKFRTMVTNADKIGTLVTMNGDSRITRAGEKLRKYRLDEIPQLLNIIAGDMTFVGTRPEVKKYVNEYTRDMFATLLLPAGITSRTSIFYKDEDVMIEKYMLETQKDGDEVYTTYILPEKMKYNLEYLKGFSILNDIKIMALTAMAVVKH